MKIDNELILKLEGLNRLELTPDERIRMRADLEKILKLCDQLKEVNTDGIEPLVYLGAQEQRLRADEVEGMVERKDALKNAANKNSEYFKVPKVIK